MAASTRYFGSPEQQALERRAELLWQVVGGDPRFAHHGRAVAVALDRVEDVDLQIAMARLQGVCPSPRLTPEVKQARAAAIEAAGLVVDVYDHWRRDADSMADVAEVLARRALPGGLAVREATADMSAADYDRIDALTASCGVLLPASAFLGGAMGPAVCLFAETAEGEAVGLAASVMEQRARDGDPGFAMWGMLSTAEAWRGRGIAKTLGARVLMAMAERHGIRHFGTGIRSDNVESARLCAGLGFAPSGSWT